MRYLFTLLLVFCFCFVQAQRKERTMDLYGAILDHVTHAEITEARTTLMHEDSTVIDSCVNVYGNLGMKNLYQFRNVGKGNYLMKVEKKGYETLFATISIDKIYNREKYRMLPDVYMKRPDVHDIGEVVVTATKVKFYHKGDTLVYNADAFQLSDGSMLDALIKQLPGAELKTDGRIYVNGRFVESLMLNGKDFFKGKNEILLQNLPTYAVNTIKVYEKAGEKSEFMGRDMNDKSFVMDVNLKKQYNIGWMGNVDAGMANHDLYMARMFLMRSTDHSQLIAYGNLNNMNDHTTPGNYSDWTPDKMPYGRLSAKMAGVSLNIDDRSRRFEYQGNANITHFDNHETQNVFRQNFLKTGDTYERENLDARYCNFALGTDHRLTLHPGGTSGNVLIKLSPSARYTHSKNTSKSVAATADESWNNVTDFTELLSQPVLSDNLRARLLNRRLQNSFYDRKSWNADINAQSFIKIRHSTDMIYIFANGSVYGQEKSPFAKMRTDFFGLKPGTDFRNRYSDITPERGYSYDVSADHNIDLNDKIWISLEYTYKNKYKHSASKLYCLEKLEGWGEDSDRPIGALPSETEYLSTIDHANSYNMQKHDNSHRLRLMPFFKIYENSKSAMNLQPGLTIDADNERMRYGRAAVDTAFHRSNVFVKPMFTAKWMTRDIKHFVEFNYDMDYKVPDMLYAISFADDSDPLETTTYGNKNLKNAQYHNFSLSYDYRGARTKISQYARLHIKRNNVAAGYMYDEETGQRQYSFFNVNGNWDMSTGLNVSGNIGKKKTTDFTSRTRWNYYHSVDMIGTTSTSVPLRSTVKTSVLSEDLSMSRKIGNHNVGLKGSVSWTRSAGDRDDFTTIDAYNFNYGAWAFVNLPWKFQLDTDFTVYSRRGYEDASMNDNNLVWNARLTRPVFKGRVVLKVDAFDIFHQLKKVDRAINSQGRVERFYNTLPRYVLVHAVYRFNAMPKNKK